MTLTRYIAAVPGLLFTILCALPLNAQTLSENGSRITFSEPWLTISLDLNKFIDPANPQDDTIAQVTGGLFRGDGHEALLARLLAVPAYRLRYQSLAETAQRRASEGVSSDRADASERTQGGEGNDVLFILSGDSQADINGGAGHNLGVIVGSGNKMTLNLRAARLQVLLGGDGPDLVIAGGRSTIMVDAGSGSDIIIGSAANDVLSGGLGDDLVDGGAGNDLIRGGDGDDQLLGSVGDDYLDGGAGSDRLVGGDGNDVLSGQEGDDVLEGGEGTDIAIFRGKVSEYRILRLDERTVRVVDSRFGRDGSDTLQNIEGLAFSDWSSIRLDESTPIPMDDTLYVLPEPDTVSSARGRLPGPLYRIASSRILANDLLPVGGVSVIRALLDENGQEIPQGVWRPVRGGLATWSAQGEVMVKSINFPDDMSFRYRIISSGARAFAWSAANRKPEEIWATVVLRTRWFNTQHVSRPRECNASCTLEPDEEHLILTGEMSANGAGNDLPNILTGNRADNVLDGGRGADLMQGGGGADTYFVDHPDDRIEEKDQEGIDTVLAAIELPALPPAVENLALLPGVVSGTGNELANRIWGNAGANILMGLAGDDLLDGGKGADRLIGGLGNDTFFVDEADDLVIELDGEGSSDTVCSEITYSLPPHVENLRLIGSGGIHGRGNQLDNHIIGNPGNNLLQGEAGNDTLEGGAGNDRLEGGSGDDRYVYRPNEGHDVIREDGQWGGGLDTLEFAPNFKPASLRLMRQGDDLVITRDGLTLITVSGWYEGKAHRIERITAGGYLLDAEAAEALAAASAQHDVSSAATEFPGGRLSPETREPDLRFWIKIRNGH